MPTTQTTLPPPQLDETCDRIVAALTQRLARAADDALGRTEAITSHDFLVPVPCPEFSEEPVSASVGAVGR